MNAKSSYEIKRKQINVQLQRLTEGLDRLDKDHENDPNNWAIVGDLEEVHLSLERALDFLMPVSKTMEPF